ncbi:hypothetical protein HN873_020551, partial [Arachis hypogaea]
MATSCDMKKFVAIVVITMLALVQGENIATTKNFEPDFKFKKLLCHGKCILQCALSKPNPIVLALCLGLCISDCIHHHLTSFNDSHCIVACTLSKSIEDRL